MDAFAKSSADDRRAAFEESAARMGLTSGVIEKDFWVCWILRRLFSLAGIPTLLFKGGTSLSKVYKLIERLSEDIDVSLNRHELGFFDDRDPAQDGISNTKRKKLIGELETEVVRMVNEIVQRKLGDQIAAVLGKDGWSLQPDPTDDERMTLLFQYPAAVPYPDYLKPAIKIEFGRGEQQPNDEVSIRPYVAEQFPGLFKDPETKVRVLAAQRTFWEKVTLAHAENNRPREKPLKAGMSRHYSDLARMAQAEEFQDARLNLKLLTDVIAHKSVFYSLGWAKYETAVPGGIHIYPVPDLEKELRKDYREMRLMFFREPPSFDEVLAAIRDLEQRLNKGAPAHAAAPAKPAKPAPKS